MNFSGFWDGKPGKGSEGEQEGERERERERLLYLSQYSQYFEWHSMKVGELMIE